MNYTTDESLGVIGVGIAALGSDGVNWGWNGVSQVFAAWAIAPGIAGAFGAIIFLITKYGVHERQNPVRKAFYALPAYFGIAAALLTSKPQPRPKLDLEANKSLQCSLYGRVVLRRSSSPVMRPSV
jgi:phosphate/sulfate permease